MNKIKLLFIGGAFLILAGLMTAGLSAQDSPAALPTSLSGIVINADGLPLAGAIVQIQGTPITTETTDDGAFTFNTVEGPTPLVLTAWTDNYYIGYATLDSSSSANDITISLKPLPQRDHSDYNWYSFDGVDGSAACGQCHREYNEWKMDQHSRSAINHKFLNMYTGTNRDGDYGQPVKFDSTGIPLPPDPNQPYTGPGFMVDNPGRAGNCATCHTPIASQSPNTKNCAWSGCHTDLTIQRANGVIDPPARPLALSGDALEGISCEICHKTVEVVIDPETHMPLPDMPGILSMRLLRPENDNESQQVFFGTLVDVNRQDSYLPQLSSSEFCAACHVGVFGGVVGMGEVTNGTVIYNSYGEWLNSTYSDPNTGQTCQDCHMPQSDSNWFVFPDKGGLVRDYQPLHNHTMLGAADEQFMQNAVTMDAHAERVDDQIQVEVSITNDKTGHDVPTGVPLRSMMLVVEALDADGQPLALLDGSSNPDWAGDYGGLPGKTFAKVLRDDWTGETPTGAFWRPVTLVEDNRIAPLATDSSTYTFEAPDGAVSVNVRLIYRRAFYALMQQKGWDDPDILMEHATLQLAANSG